MSNAHRDRDRTVQACSPSLLSPPFTLTMDVLHFGTLDPADSSVHEVHRFPPRTIAASPFQPSRQDQSVPRPSASKSRVVPRPTPKHTTLFYSPLSSIHFTFSAALLYQYVCFSLPV